VVAALAASAEGVLPTITRRRPLVARQPHVGRAL
jgi:hypothetical protein